MAFGALCVPAVALPNTHMTLAVERNSAVLESEGSLTMSTIEPPAVPCAFCQREQEDCLDQD